MMDPTPKPTLSGEADANKLQIPGEAASSAAAATNAQTTEGGASDGEKPVDTSIVSRDMNNSQIEDLFDRRRRWGKNIQIYRLIDGKFQPKELDEEIKKQ